MAAAPKTPRLPAPRGSAWVNLLLLLVLGTGAYLAWVWVPVYVTWYQAQQLVRQVGNEAVHARDDDQLLQELVARLRGLRQVESVGEDGQPRLRPAVDLQAQNVIWERKEPASLRVAFEYEHEVLYPYLDRKVDQVMAVDLTMDVSLPNWGPK